MSTTRSPGLSGQDRARNSFRVVGVVLLVVALGLLGLGLQDFFSSLSSDSKEAADQIWMAFVGLLLLGPAGWCLQSGFMGSVNRYAAGEPTPALAVTEAPTGPDCGQCGTRKDAAATFCDGCGAAFAG